MTVCIFELLLRFPLLQKRSAHFFYFLPFMIHNFLMGGVQSPCFCERWPTKMDLPIQGGVQFHSTPRRSWLVHCLSLILDWSSIEEHLPHHSRSIKMCSSMLIVV
ncbi:hypothetical protein NC651_010215 [Populus alba x Populus x berolinensis]|nr:hypothetical protein NC651_010215 [Populus alba x Populus x berolinensis]